MGIVSICFIVLIVGLVISFATNFDSVTGLIMLLIGCSGAIVIVVAVAVVVPFEGKDSIIKYHQDVTVIELTYNNPKLTGEERSQAIALANEDNAAIIKNKYWSSNFWICAFYYKPIGELPLFDLNKISQANTLVEINGN